MTWPSSLRFATARAKSNATSSVRSREHDLRQEPLASRAREQTSGPKIRLPGMATAPPPLGQVPGPEPCAASQRTGTRTAGYGTGKITAPSPAPMPTMRPAAIRTCVSVGARRCRLCAKRTDALSSNRSHSCALGQSVSSVRFASGRYPRASPPASHAPEATRLKG